MGLSIFLAKLIGIYFLIVFVLLLLRRTQMIGAFRQVVASKGLLAVSAEVSLLFGLAIAIDHSIWEISWKGLITLIGYLLIIKGIMRLAFASQVRKCFNKMMTKKGIWITMLITLVIGVYLTYCGFTYGQ